MRKVDNSTSQDGADTTSITSIFENEVKKSSIGLKTKRSSLKRKLPNFSHDSDETVIEPLLQSETHKSDKNLCAKLLIPKSKSDLTDEVSEKQAIVSETVHSSLPTCVSQNIPYTTAMKETSIISRSSVTTPVIYNHMNVNVFGGKDSSNSIPTKSAVIVEIDNSKSSSFSPSPLIFTTAKIHTDDKTKQMEPFQITPVPILSTIEGNIIKSIPSTFDSEEKHYESVKLKNDRQEKINNENDQMILKSALIDKGSIKVKTLPPESAPKPKSTTVSKEYITLTTTETKPVQNNLRPVFDKSSKGPSDSKISITFSIRDNETTAAATKSDALQLDKTSSSMSADKMKKNLPVKLKGLSSPEESKDKPEKLDNQCAGAVRTTTDSTNKEKAAKTTNSLSSNKQLHRQKNATAEDITDTGIRQKVVNTDYNPEQTNVVSVNIGAGLSNTKIENLVINKPISKISEAKNATAISKPHTTVSNISTISSKTNVVTSMPTSKPNTIITSAKTSTTGTKNVASNREYPKPVTITTGSDIPKSNIKSAKEITASTSANISKLDNAGSLKSEKNTSTIKSEKFDVSSEKKSDKTALPNVTACVPSEASKSLNKSLGNQTTTAGASTLTTTSKGTGISSLPSTTSAKPTLTGKTKVEPLISQNKKESRA
ncbi:uncharacterized protein [Battus philenor]|uniref:uncharacterized protein n=1 Tax=Battus philenor TaxID=42288 RepID=UPI0035D0E121